MTRIDTDEESRRAHAAPLFADVSGDARVSFEFFPPKTEKMEETLWESLQTLAPLGPRFVSVTYGAGGSTRERTHATVARIARETPIAAAAHLTCVEATREEIDAVAEEYWASGVRHIVALRAIRRARARNIARTRAATRMPPRWSRASGSCTRSRSRWPPIPSATRIRPIRATTSTI